MLSDHLKGTIIVVICGILGWLWNELQKLIKSHEVNSIRIDHLERDNQLHKENHKGLYESLFAMVKELKQDISDLKETFLKNKHD
jgi:hypothetical protein